MPDDFQYLKSRAAECFRGLKTVLDTLNKKYPKPDYRWEMDEDKGIVRRVKLPEMAWEPFEEPNDFVWSEADQQLVIGQR